MPIVTEKAASNSKDKYMLLEVNNKRFPFTFNENILNNIPSLKLRDDDIMICGYMRAGTHWMFEILNMLVTGHVETIPHMKESLQLEQASQEMIDTFPSPRVLNLHLLFEDLPREVKERKTKIIYLVRDPRDSLVSWYTCIKKIWPTIIDDWEMSLPDWFELYINGKLEWGSWFDHILSWEKVLQQHKDHPIHLVYYEDLLRDTVGEITKIKNFLGVDRDEEFCRKVADKTQFKKMAQDKDKFTQKFGGQAIHYNKGIIGNWKTMFTVSISEEFDQLYERKMSESRFRDSYSKNGPHYS